MRQGLTVLLLIFLVGCARLQEPKGPARESEEPPNQVIWNGKIEVTRDGKLQSVINTGRTQLFEKKKVTLLDSGVVVDFYNKLGQHTSKLTSQRARVEEAKDLFLAEGDVVVRSDSGALLRTERLYWDKTQQKIRSDTLVVMTTQYDSLRGYIFEANEDLTAWQLQKPTGQTFRRVAK